MLYCWQAQLSPQTKTHLFRQIKVQGAVSMTHEAMQEANPKSWDGSVPPSAELPVVAMEYIHGPSEREEQAIFVGRQAVNLVVAVGVSLDQDIKEREVKRFLKNADYNDSTPEAALESQVFVNGVIDAIDGMVKTETAAALKAQNETLRKQIEDIKRALALQPAEVLLAVAPLLKLPKPVEIDVEEFAHEVQEGIAATGDVPVPTTAELEAQFLHETDDTVSPARGIALLGHLAMGAARRTLEFVSTK